MLRTTAVYSVMLGAPKCARSKRILSHARSIEVCTEQPFYKSCSEHRSMHGATFYSVVLGASRVCMDKPFFNNVRPNFGQLSFTLLFSISATSMRISAILWYSVCSELFVFIDMQHA